MLGGEELVEGRRELFAGEVIVSDGGPPAGTGELGDAMQHPRDIVHAAECARWLQRRGISNVDLIAAALLHDIAKGAQRRWDRTAAVLAGALGLSEAAAHGDSRFELRRALQRTREHSREGARVLQAAGAPAAVVELTRLHHLLTTTPEGRDGMLALLQEADAAT